MTESTTETEGTRPSPCGQPGTSMPEVFDAVTALAKRLGQFESRTLRESGLTPPQFFVLTQLDGGERTLADLASAAGCTRATMTGIADTLERNGLARRIPNAADRRSVLSPSSPTKADRA
jgi:hypothetical protein